MMAVLKILFGFIIFLGMISIIIFASIEENKMSPTTEQYQKCQFTIHQYERNFAKKDRTTR